MRFTAALIASALSAVAVAQTTSASPSYSIDPAQASVVACLDKCADTDIDCLARCNPVPNPSEDQVIALDKCVGDCDQGDGSDADSKKYEECRASCIAEHYYNTSEGTPKATGAAGSGSNGNSGSNNAQTTGTDSAGGAGATGSSDNDDEDNSNNSDSDSATRTNGSGDETSGTGSGNAAQETTDSPDAASQLVGSGAALFALAAAVFAL
ncbi:hypothetical protein CC79DRAFT_1365288 [Sarocladium strictum]